MTGNLLFSNSGTAKRGIQGTVGDNDQWFIGGAATGSNAGYMEISVGDDGSSAGSYENIYVRQYLGTPLTGSIRRTLTLLDNNGNTSVPNNMTVGGLLTATTKSFTIDHPTKEGHKLRYGSLEGPENGIYVRGRLTDNNVIILPEYWTELVDPESITVQLTAIGSDQKLYVKDIIDNHVIIENSKMFSTIDCFYIVQAERIDVEKLVTEFKE